VKDPRPNLYGMDREALAAFLQRYGAPAYHADQVYRWLYSRGRLDPAEWTDLSKELRADIARDGCVLPGEISDLVEASDGTIKYRVRLPGGDSVESVYMAQSDRVTLCLSSQVGCALGCDFCLTAKMGLVRHLRPGEIVGQVAQLVEARHLAETTFNIVFMGMGEPLHNYSGVVAAYRLLVDPDGFGLSRRRITVSTAGLVPAIEKLASEKIRLKLAVSLNATTNEVRDRIMPINRRYPIEQLIRACRLYAARTGEPFTFEYVLLKGVNDTADDLLRLVKIVRSAPAKLNLIPFNPVPERLSYQPPSRRRIEEIRDRLIDDGLRVGIRWSRGADARAACGQLALLSGASPDSAQPRGAAP
jgi:23S rRNA (adenine2503-C2)-methyltransferase